MPDRFSIDWSALPSTDLSLHVPHDALSLPNIHWSELWGYTISCVPHALTWGKYWMIKQPYVAAALLCIFALGNPGILTALLQLTGDICLLLLHLVIFLCNILVLFINLIKHTLRFIYYALRFILYIIGFARRGVKKASLA